VHSPGFSGKRQSADRAALFDSAQNHEAYAAELAFVVLLLEEILSLCSSISGLRLPQNLPFLALADLKNPQNAPQNRHL
jgi:hypothetical protein